MKRTVLLFSVALLVAGACANPNVGFLPDASSNDASSADVPSLQDVIFPGDAPPAAFDVQPSTEQTLNVACNAQTPTVQYTASAGGNPLAADWNVDRAEIGKMNPQGPIPASTFVPTGTTGGIANVLATAASQTVSRSVFVQLGCQQNGPSSDPREQQQIANTVGDLSTGGGIGGVGGEGLGGAVTDVPTLNALTTPTSDPSLKFLYPYDKTVWPRGMLAPLLMWDWTTGDADAIEINLATTSGSFTWSGKFSRPAILQQTGGKFIRHPIPQDIWDMATNTAGTMIHGARDDLKVSVIVAKNGQAYGPITETWHVAAARLTGTVYYASYGTHFAATASTSNWPGQDKAGHWIGGAVLGIRSGDTGPHLVAGTPNAPNCRVCHTVASHGRWLTSPPSLGGTVYSYDLTTTNPEATEKSSSQNFTTTAALTSDGTYWLTNAAVDPSRQPPSNQAPSNFWKFDPNTQTVQSATLNGFAAGTAAAYPSFSPDDKHLAYVDGTSAPSNIRGPLVTGTFDINSLQLGSLTTLATPASGQRIGFPAFLADNSGIVFQTQVRDVVGGTYLGSSSQMETIAGARGELWWVNLSGAPQPVALASLNGKGYLPIATNDHGIAGGLPDPEDNGSPANEVGWDDTTLAYQPTTLPLAAGGYAWVVFTSRRLYGSVLTVPPWQSYPQDYDTSNLALATTKKLWVAAIDLNAPAGSDPSHPAFYLPAQEILAGNMRGFWALDPCHKDGDGCTSGDQCCGGYCESPQDGGAGPVCTSTKPTCGGEGDHCVGGSDCCAGMQCVGGSGNGHCDVIPIQ